MRPSNPTLHKYYDKALGNERREMLLAGDAGPEAEGECVRAAEQWLVEYACRRIMALDKDRANKAGGVPPKHFYKSRLARAQEQREKIVAQTKPESVTSD